MSTITLLTVGLAVITVIGFALEALLMSNLAHKRKSYKASRAKNQELMKNLSADTQVILQNYMYPINFHGQQIFAVRNIKRFDALLKEHTFYDLGDNCGDRRWYCFDKYIKEQLKQGEAFTVIVNNKEYVAVSPAFLIDPDSLIYGFEHN